MRRRSWIALGLLAAAAGVAAWIWLHREGQPSARSQRTSAARRLDVEVFRVQLAARMGRARQIAARPPPLRRSSPSPPTGKWKNQGLGALPDLGKRLIDPECTLGPRELCTTLIPLITACDDGDASDCIAVGQFVADTPPRSAFAMAFFAQACRIGDAAGCERVDELKSNEPVPCESDPLACSLRAMRLQDRELHDDACSLGAAESCAFMVELTKDEPATSRAYLETGCQLGEPVMCMELGRRLQPDCEVSEFQLCYEPDPQQARVAREIACAAGWEKTSVCEDE